MPDKKKKQQKEQNTDAIEDIIQQQGGTTEQVEPQPISLQEPEQTPAEQEQTKRKSDIERAKDMVLNPLTMSQYREYVAQQHEGYDTGLKIKEYQGHSGFRLLLKTGISVVAARTEGGKTNMLTTMTLNLLHNYNFENPDVNNKIEEDWDNQYIGDDGLILFISLEEPLVRIMNRFINAYIGNNDIIWDEKGRIKSILHFTGADDSRQNDLLQNGKNWKPNPVVGLQHIPDFFETYIGTRRLVVASMIGATTQGVLDLISFTKKHSNLKVVVLDYIQILSADGTQKYNTEQLKIKDDVIRLQSHAENNNIALLTGAQHNREAGNEATKMGDTLKIRESDDIAQRAEFVLGLNRNINNIVLLKNRHGEKGSAGCTLLGEQTRFTQDIAEVQNYILHKKYKDVLKKDAPALKDEDYQKIACGLHFAENKDIPPITEDWVEDGTGYRFNIAGESSIKVEIDKDKNNEAKWNTKNKQ